MEEEIRAIIEEFKDGNPEPLDGDEVDRLTEIFREKVNLMEGNITEEQLAQGGSCEK